jgi:vacuolar iron transporter family protein
MFAIGAAVPLIPFLFTEGGTAVVISSAIAGLMLFGVGVASSALTGRSLWLSAARMLLIGAAAAGITYAVGRVLDVTVTQVRARSRCSRQGRRRDVPAPATRP